MCDDVEGWDCSEYKDFSESESDTSNISYEDEDEDEDEEQPEFTDQTEKKTKKKKIEGESFNKSKRIQYSTILQEEMDYLPE